jgi:acyl-coenzyme A synthetase/AMP-(fatty) acid ligase
VYEVIGIYDTLLTEKIVACIKLKENGSKWTKSLQNLLERNLEQEKSTALDILEELPKGISGKNSSWSIKKHAKKNIKTNQK